MEIEYTPAHIADLERVIAELRERKSHIVKKKIEWEKNLIELNNMANARGDKQAKNTIAEIKLRLREVENEIQNINSLIRAKTTLKTDIQQELKNGKLILKGTSSEIREHLNVIDNSDSLLRLKMIELKGKYMDFAKDHTRIHSMKAMASEFVKELDTILKNKR